MTELEAELWRKIENFELDDPTSSFSFSDRLARENDWSLAYSLRAIYEYKKFIFLVCIASEPLTPSDQIDQVWHLHLLYTQSYWIEFCDGILHRPIHHGPTKGREEQIRFHDQYEFTLSFYSNTFKTNPPVDIWPEPRKRFRSIHFSRVNRQLNWVIPKFKFFIK